MMNLTLWDHVFAVLVFIIFPVYAKLSFKTELAAIKDGGETARIKAYKHVIATWVAFSLYVLIIWQILDRPWNALGIQASDLTRTSVGLILAGIIVLIIFLQLRGILDSRERHYEIDSQLGDLAILMPKSENDVRWFTCVSANAGISEELIFRGYLIWYMQHFMGLWPAAVVSVILFGLAHAYQGWKQLPGILLIAAVATGLFLYTRSLLVPILFHFVVDAVQGVYIAKIQNARSINTAEARSP